MLEQYALDAKSGDEEALSKAIEEAKKIVNIHLKGSRSMFPMLCRDFADTTPALLWDALQEWKPEKGRFTPLFWTRSRQRWLNAVRDKKPDGEDIDEMPWLRDNAPQPSAHLIHSETFALAKERLDERAYKVLVDRYLFSKTYAEVGKELGVTAQRIEQIEKAALKCLRFYA